MINPDSYKSSFEKQIDSTGRDIRILNKNPNSMHTLFSLIH